MLNVGSAVLQTATGTITGTVVDSETGEALTGVTCTLTTDASSSDIFATPTISGADDGSFTVSALGNCTLTLEKDGYDPVELTVSVDMREDVDVGEIAMTPSSNEEALRAKLKELIETYGIFASGQSGTAANYVVSSWLDPTGILSATILDLDADGSLELQVCRTEEWLYNGSAYTKVLMEVYEADTQTAYLADSLWFEPYGFSQDDDTSYVHGYVALTDTESSRSMATVNAVQMETGYYLVCEYYMQGVLGDGGYGATWVLEYQNGALQYVCSLENGGMGSSVETGFAYEFEDGVNTKTTMYYGAESDLSYWEGAYTDLEEWGSTSGVLKTAFFEKYGLEFTPTETEFTFYYDLFSYDEVFYGFSGTTSGDTNAEMEFRLVVNATDTDYTSGTFAFEETLTRGNDLLADSSETSAEVPDEADDMDIVLDTEYTSEGYEFGTLYAYGSDGELVWSYETDAYPATELEQISEIGLRDGCYYFVESGTVVAMDAVTGETLWENNDFGGAGTSAVFAEDSIYLAGYYGPDFYAVSYDGETLCEISSFGTEYYWASIDAISGNTALVSLNDGYYEAHIDLTTWEYTIENVS